MEKSKSLWSFTEINALLDVMIDEKAMLLLEDKTTRKRDIYKLLKNRLNGLGYARDEAQIKCKFQKLKSQFLRARLNKNRSGSYHMDDNFYRKMEELIKDCPTPSSKRAGHDPRRYKTVENKRYQPVIKTMSDDFSTSMKEERKNLFASLEKLQKEDHKFLEQMQRNEHAFLLQLFGGCSYTPPESEYYLETTHD